MLKIRSLPSSDNGKETACALAADGRCDGDCRGSRSGCVGGKGCGNGGGIIST